MTTEPTERLYDVVAVDISTFKVTAIYGERQTFRNASAIIDMAVIRRGTDRQFYTHSPVERQLKVGDAFFG